MKFVPRYPKPELWIIGLHYQMQKLHNHRRMPHCHKEVHHRTLENHAF